MELPPGWRGYGAKDYIDHPDTRGASGGGRGGQGEARRRGPLRACSGAHAVRAAAAGALPRAATSASTRGFDRLSRPTPGASHADDPASCATTRRNPGSAPRMQAYELEEADGMTLFIALNEIREKQDPSLQFDFVCRAGICGSCGDDDQRPAGPRLPHAHRERRARDHARAAAGVRADRRPVGEHRQVDARDERAARRPGST